MISRRYQLLLAASAALAGTAAFTWASRRRPRPLATVAHVNLDHYLGRWYEIARLPAGFERGCSHTTAEYTRAADGSINVFNACLKNGQRKTALGKATVADPQTNARLKVSFFWPFRGDYWILALDNSYQWALVGEPHREHLWILSRTPHLSPDVVERLVEHARKEGFPVEQLIFTPQE